MIRKITFLAFCLFSLIGLAETSGINFGFHTGIYTQTLLSEDIDSITFGHEINSTDSIWNYSESSGNTTSWMTTGSQVINDITLKDGKLYVVRRNHSNEDNTIEIIDAYMGNRIGALNTCKCVTGAHYISSIEKLGNSIIACNLSTDGKSNLVIYKWDSDTSVPTEMLNTVPPCSRIGDAMSVSGDMANGRIWFANGSCVYYYTVVDGEIISSTPTQINLIKGNNLYYNSSNSPTTYSNITVENDRSFWVSSRTEKPAHFTENGIFIESFPDILPDVQGTDLKFIINGSKYAIVSFYLNESQASLSNGAISIVNMATETIINSLPSTGLGNTRNTSFRNSICTEVHNGYFYVWINIPSQGAACYKIIEDIGICETIWTKHGTFVNQIKNDDYILFNTQTTTDKYGITLGTEIDLGLSVNWSGWDLGATSTRGYGSHFAWGELIPRTTNFTAEGYVHGESTDIGTEISGSEDYDAARHLIGGDWRLPTKEEAEELLNKCKWEQFVCDNILGLKVTGPNGNSIFFPLTGHIVGDALVDNGLHCCYWTGSLSTENSKFANVLLYEPKNKEQNKTKTVVENRRFGHCIRPVRSKK